MLIVQNQMPLHGIVWWMLLLILKKGRVEFGKIPLVHNELISS